MQGAGSLRGWGLARRGARRRGERSRRTAQLFPAQLNADGFGVGWYAPELDSKPCVFTSTQPAWNNKNLSSLAEVSSQLMFAHVRAATTGSPVTETNCHPFVFGQFMFMHNGAISDFKQLRRQLVMDLRDDIFNSIEGTTDSEHAFALFLNELSRLEVRAKRSGDAAQLKTRRFAHHQLAEALLASIARLAELRRMCKLATPDHSTLNFAVTDGRSVVVTRYVGPAGRAPATMYFACGTEFKSLGGGKYRMVQRDRREDVVIVASERLTHNLEDWVEVPPNSILTITPQLNLLVKPISRVRGGVIVTALASSPLLEPGPPSSVEPSPPSTPPPPNSLSTSSGASSCGCEEA